MKAVLIALAMVLVASSAGAQPSAVEPQPAEQHGGARGQGARAPGLPPVVALTEADITGFLGAAPELNRLGVKAGKDPAGQMGKLAASSEASAIIERHGFTPQRFQQVAYSIGISMAALDTQKSDKDAAAARADQERALAQMKKQLPPEQYELMKAQLEAAMAAAAKLENQPPQNLELVRKHRAAIESRLTDD